MGRGGPPLAHGVNPSRIFRCPLPTDRKPRAVRGSVWSHNDANQNFASQRAVVAVNRQDGFYCYSQEICVPDFRIPIIFQTSDQFFLPLIAFVIFFYSRFDDGGKFEVLLKSNQLFDETLQQSVPLGRVSRGGKLLFKINNVLLFSGSQNSNPPNLGLSIRAGEPYLTQGRLSYSDHA